MGLLGNGFDDPQSAAIMALAGGLMQGNAGQGLLGANQAFMQAKKAQQEAKYDELRGLLAQAQLANVHEESAAKKEARERDAALQAKLPSLFRQPGFTGGQAVPQSFGGTDIPMFSAPMNVAPMQARPGGFDVPGALLAGMPPDMAKKYAETLDYGQEVARTQEIDDGQGGKKIVQLSKRGQPVGQSFAGYVPPVQVDRGGSVDFYRPAPGRSVAKTGDPFKDLLVTGPDGQPALNSPLLRAKSTVAAAGAPRMTMVNKQEGEESKAVGKFFGENYADVQKAGLMAQSSINRIDRLSQLLDGVDTGKFAPLGVEVAKGAQAFGFNIDPKLANKEAAVALSSEIALQLRNPSGGAGMPGAMSDADRNFLTGMVPGIEKTPEGRKMIVNTARKLAQRDMEVAKMAREYRQKNGTINEGFYDRLAQFSEANPLFTGAQSAPQGGNLTPQERQELEALRKQLRR